MATDTGATRDGYEFLDARGEARGNSNGLVGDGSATNGAQFSNQSYGVVPQRNTLQHASASAANAVFGHINPLLSGEKNGSSLGQHAQMLYPQRAVSGQSAQSMAADARAAARHRDELFEQESDEDGDGDIGEESATNTRDQEDQTDPPPGFTYLPPPPALSYTSPHEAIEAMHAWNKEHGFDVSKQKPGKNKNGELYKYLFRCTRHGKLDNHRKLTDETRKRKRQSGKIGCPMGIYIKAEKPADPAGVWWIVHQQHGKSKWHNHGPSQPEELSGHRRRGRTDELKGLIVQQREAGFDATQTLAYLKQQMPGVLVTRQDILNYRRGDSAGMSDHTNYRDKPYFLCVSFLEDIESDPIIGQPLLNSLRSQIPVSVCTKPDQFARHFERNEPRVVLVTDGALAHPDYRLHLARVVTFNQDGGTVIFMGDFARTQYQLVNTMLFHHYGLEWEALDDTTSNPSNIRLNRHAAAGSGECAVVAKNFASGTDTKSIEALLALCPDADLVSCRLYAMQPIVVAELVFATLKGAESVVNSFNGKAINLGRVSTAPGRELVFTMRPPSAMSIKDLPAIAYVKTNYLAKVNTEHVVYEYVESPNMYGAFDPSVIQQTNPPTAAVAYIQVGKGWLGYTGVVDYDENYAKLIASMCHL
jgi:hypothetical protein